MERLRHVARTSVDDPALIVAETVGALDGLAPGASELVPLCRNLIERHPACGPLWWLCAHLLAGSDGDAAWDLAMSIEHDPTAATLAEELADDVTVLTVGVPRIVAAALCVRPEVRVLAVESGSRSGRFVRLLDRLGVAADAVAPEAMLAAVRRVDVVLVEADACSSSTVVTRTGGGLAAVAASSVGAPVWLVAGRGRRLPARYVEAIAARVTGGVGCECETFSPGSCERVAGPAGVRAFDPVLLAPECPEVPELLRP